MLRMYAHSPDTQNIANQIRELIQISNDNPGAFNRLLQAATPEARLAALEKNIADEPENARHYMEIIRQCIRENRMEDAKKWMREADEKNAGVDLRFEMATLLAGEGKADEAFEMLQSLVDDNPKHFEALAMLAFIMIDREDVEGVRRDVLDKIEREEGTRRGYYYQLVSGKLALLEKQLAVAREDNASAIRFQQQARDHYYNAYRAKPQVTALTTLVLELDFALGDQVQARRHATEFLRRDRNHAMASWVLGSLLFMDGDYEAAEQYFKQSVESKPEARNLNDYAEVLRRVGKVEMSEVFARRAVDAAQEENAPRYEYNAWDTLARALFVQKKYAEAKTASEESVRVALENELAFNSAQINLTRLHIVVACGEADAARLLAREIETEIRKSPDALDKEEAGEFQKLREKIAEMR